MFYHRIRRSTFVWLLIAALAIWAGCTYSGGSPQANGRSQAATADPYTYEFERRTPPGGD